MGHAILLQLSSTEAIREGASSAFERRLDVGPGRNGSQHLNLTLPDRYVLYHDICGNPSGLRDSRKIVDGVGQLEGSFGVATFQVALLIPEAEDNRVALFGNLAPFGCLEVHGARKMRALG